MEVEIYLRTWNRERDNSLMWHCREFMLGEWRDSIKGEIECWEEAWKHLTVLIKHNYLLK